MTAPVFPLRYGHNDPADHRRWYELEIQKNQPFENRCGQPNFTLHGKVGGFTTDDAVDARQLGAQCWLMEHGEPTERVVFDSDGEVFMAYSDDLEPLLDLVILLRTEIDGPPSGRDQYTEAWAAMLRREERIVR